MSTVILWRLSCLWSCLVPQMHLSFCFCYDSMRLSKYVCLWLLFLNVFKQGISTRLFLLAVFVTLPWCWFYVLSSQTQWRSPHMKLSFDDDGGDVDKNLRWTYKHKLMQWLAVGNCWYYFTPQLFYTNDENLSKL